MANILVVEDERLIAGLLKETLEIEGYQVVTVLNGEDAVHYALRETPHLIVLDLMLPGIDGYEVVRRLRNHPKTMHIPIVVLSALIDIANKLCGNTEMSIVLWVTFAGMTLSFAPHLNALSPSACKLLVVTRKKVRLSITLKTSNVLPSAA